MNKNIYKTAIISSSILLYTAFSPAAVFSSGNGDQVCPNPTIKSYESGNESEMSYTDSNNNIENICIKSGSKMFGGNMHSGPLGNGTYENGCYEVSGIGTSSVTVKRLNDGNTCQGISHLDIFTKENTIQADPEPTPTPELTIVEKVVKKRVEVITETVYVNNTQTQEVLSSNTTQLANTGINLTLAQKIVISLGLLISSLPLSVSLKKRFA